MNTPPSKPERARVVGGLSPDETFASTGVKSRPSPYSGILWMMQSRQALCVSVALAVLAVGCSSSGNRHALPTTTTTTTAPQAFPPIAGMIAISDGTRPVGYVPEDLFRLKTIAAIRAQNARTLIPVTLADGTLVGYIAQGVPFVPLAEVKKPGFDIEAVRARHFGGCEPQIGDPTFKQEFPHCPPPANNPAPPTLGRRFGPLAPYQRGIGQVRPSSISLVGDPTGIVNHIQWQSWGAARASGRGTGFFVPPGRIVADAVSASATVVAFKLGSCQGTRAYQAIEWFYPQHGGAFDAHNYINICTGDHVGPP
jgi:hypothetical protein